MLIPCTMAITKKYLSVLKTYCMNWNYLFWSPGKIIVAVVAYLCWECLSTTNGKHKSAWAGSAPGCVLTRGAVREDDCCQYLSPCFMPAYHMRRVASGNLHLSEIKGKPLDTVCICRRRLPPLSPRLTQMPFCFLLISSKLNPSLASTPSFVSLHPSSTCLFQLSPYKLWLFPGPQNR